MDKEVRKSVLTFHKSSGRHVLVLEADMSQEDKCTVFGDSEKVRLIMNELRRMIKSPLEQLMRTKRYRKLRTLYHDAATSGDTKSARDYAKQLAEMREVFGIDFETLRAESIKLKHKYDLHSHIVRSALNIVWRGVDEYLFGAGRKLNFTKKNQHPALTGNMFNTGIRICQDGDDLTFWYGRDIGFGYIHKDDRFIQEEVANIVSYLADPNGADTAAAELFREKGVVTDTFRPCYLSLVPEIIRGKLRVFIHITIEGKPVRKYDRAGDLRHKYGTGVIGVDIGSQTVAYSTPTEVGITNLGERGRSLMATEKAIADISRAMDRSRRATNPQNYKEDGTTKKGRKKWTYSNRYYELRENLRALCRTASINRKLAINELVNHLRSQGDSLITEPKNSAKLMKRAKKTEVSEKTGKVKRKKRFGKSINNRSPGYFQLKAQQVFTRTGGKYTEVANNYRASQYDVTVDGYFKKGLSCRYYPLKDGTKVQRDMYAAYLLSCSTPEGKKIDMEKCREGFEEYIRKQNDCIDDLVERKIHIVNSGIEIA